jgi:hypothetical protein
MLARRMIQRSVLQEAEGGPKRVSTGHAVLDIGQNVGALVIYTDAEHCGKEIEVSPKGNDVQRTHTEVLERKTNGYITYAALFFALKKGDYNIWSIPGQSITIVGGSVAEVDWRGANVVLVPKLGHTHRHNEAILDILPPRYRNGKAVSSAPMGTAPMRYTDEGQVAWDQMWTDFCELALAGGPPHRDTLLEPVAPEEIKADQDDYERVVSEIERGLRLVTGLSTVRSKNAGWVGLNCKDEQEALWLLRAIVVENICVRREGTVLYLPAGPAFRLEKEIKNVVTVVAKTYHYWTEHCNS